MDTFSLTPDTPKEELVAYLKTLNLKEKEDRSKFRELVRSSTPSQFFTILLPFLYESRPDIQEKLKDKKGKIQIVLTGEKGGSFVLFIGKNFSVEEKEISDPDFQIRMDVETWEKINRREIQPQVAFFQGKIRFQGNMALAMNLLTLLRG
jgi:putative sterol carrier protein